ncbi:MAG: SUF system FeS assembly protein, NifU family [Candidatus Collierbacteria bacterium GW2011_GWC2_45_15]|uniref:SUF system FeS assembly protein, NifU family n=3 Tax=Candidatus Collieribacteriota TaxID=1752725 RepID=A0A0G1JL31_9BACT|nr:MAG: SUF system FeS assembly protein, NifU family [Candidatus Collierbacteria bacterium GW2011_GWA1_44_12]KKT97525.1 MAG: SUF system FeS assembly protein, NifU family [Candidatus Collierbacteria bacterium GW2011_GWC2_45_15]
MIKLEKSRKYLFRQMSDYREEIIDHYKNPRNFGLMEKPDLEITEANSSCGDMIKIYVKKDGEKISEMMWQGVGCAISTAAASMLSERVKGMNEKELLALGDKGVVEMLGGEVNLGRINCATLAYRGLLKAFEK